LVEALPLGARAQRYKRVLKLKIKNSKFKKPKKPNNEMHKEQSKD
jgi:hypothetical protein